jgi:ADP-heptose:LPS heptosyltransferase
MTELFVDGLPYHTEIPFETPHMMFQGLLARELLERERVLSKLTCDGNEYHFVMMPMSSFSRIDAQTAGQYTRPLLPAATVTVDGAPREFGLRPDDELMHLAAKVDAEAVAVRRRVSSIVCDGEEYMKRLQEPLGYFRAIAVTTQPLDTLRKAVVTLVIGDAFDGVKDRVYRLMRAYAEKCAADFIAIETPRIFMPYPHCEKYQVFDLFETYDRILYLDADVLISPDAPNIFETVPIESVGMYDEEQYCSHLHERRLALRQLGAIDWTKGYFNSGVVCLSYPHRPLMAKAVRDTVFCAFMDQTILNYRLVKNGYPRVSLPQQFNCMSIAGDRRSDAWFVHYAGGGFLTYDERGARVSRFAQMKNDADAFCARLPKTEVEFDPRMPIADAVREAACATERFSRGEHLDERAQAFMMFAEAMDLTNEHDLVHGTRSLHVKYGFTRQKPSLHCATFEEMQFKTGARILIIDLRMIGDSVHVGEMCAAMKQRFAGLHITYLCLSGAGQVSAHSGAINALIDFPHKEYIEDVRLHERVSELLPSIARTLAQVHAGAFDAAININPSLLSMFFFYRCPDLPVYGWSFDDANRAVYRGNLYMYLFAVNRRVHLAEQMIRFLPPSRPMRPPMHLFAANDDERVPAGAVGIFPGSRISTHRWPKEYWAQLVTAIRQSSGLAVVIFGGAKEFGLAQEIMGLTGADGIVNVCGQIPLSSLGAAMARLGAMVSNDSGGKHVAVAGGVPTVEISGSGIPLDQCGPYGAWSVVLQAELDCLNCEGFVCEHCSCMTLVKPQAVLSALKALLFAHKKDDRSEAAVFDAISREPEFADLSVWFSGTKRPQESFVPVPIKVRYHAKRTRERLWSFAMDELCVAKNVALGCGAHRSSLTVKNVAGFLRGFSPQECERIAEDLRSVDEAFAHTAAVLAHGDGTVKSVAAALDAVESQEVKFLFTMNSRLAEMLTAHGSRGDAGVCFLSMLTEDLETVRESWSRIMRIATESHAR